MDSKENWSEYWGQGHSTSFGDDFKDNYQGVLRKNWTLIFERLTGEQKVLDLCSGNGTLIRLAKSVFPSFDIVEFTGVDYAEIPLDPEFKKLKNVDFLSGINIELLPFESNGYNLVMSNFGIEYSELSNSIAEAARVLKPNGQLEFICHHTGSVIIKKNKRILNALREVLDLGGVLATLKSMVIALVANESTEAELQRIHLNKQLTVLSEKDHLALEDTDFLKFLKFVLTNTTEDKLGLVQEFSNSALAHKSRLEEMVNAALDDAKLWMLKETCKNHGLEVLKISDLYEYESLIACHISAIKPN